MNHNVQLQHYEIPESIFKIFFKEHKNPGGGHQIVVHFDFVSYRAETSL